MTGAGGASRAHLKATLAVFAWLIMAPEALAQTSDPPPGPLAPPSKDPRDLSGVWQLSHIAPLRYPVIGGGPMPYLPWTAAEAKRRDAAMAAGRPVSDTTSKCMPSGIPRVMGAPYPIKILQTPKELVMLIESQHLFRIAYLNEQHPADLDPTFMGHTVGHWEGNAFVMDTVGLRGDTTLNEAGDPHSDKLHVVERWTKTADGKELDDVIEIDDPGAYAHPFSIRLAYDWKPQYRLMEYVCEENNRNPTDGNGVVGYK